MKRYLPSGYKVIIFLELLLIYIGLQSTVLFLWLADIKIEKLKFDLNLVYIFITILLIIGLIFTIFIENLVFTKKQKNSFLEIEERYVISKVAHSFTFFAIEIQTPVKNILSYKVSQPFYMKKFDFYKVAINCGSDVLQFVANGETAEEIVGVLDEIIRENSKLRWCKEND